MRNTCAECTMKLLNNIYRKEGVYMLDDVFALYWDKKGIFKLYSKQERTRDLVTYMLNRTQQLFTWTGLPDTIPDHNLEQLLQLHGSVCITEVDNVPDGRGKPGLYAFFGGLGGMLNAYYEPTIYTVANPYLEFNKELRVGIDCVRGRNDKFSYGLLPMFIKYGAMINENEISMNMLSINYRISNLISADNDRTYESAKDFLNGIVAGQFGAISSGEFFDGIRNDIGNTNGNRITDLIEYEQYLKGSWFNEIGLDANYNMKRERLNSGEADLNNDCLMPLIDNMLMWREKLCEDVKEMYGDKYDLTDLSVALNPVWDTDKEYVDIVPEETREGEEPGQEPNTEDPEEPEQEPNTEDPEEPEQEPNTEDPEEPGQESQNITITVNVNTEGKEGEENDKSMEPEEVD